MRRILYINGWGYDYLADSFLIGLKQNKNVTVYELPANQYIYKQTGPQAQSTHGKGFTLCNTIDGDQINIYREDIALANIDIFVFSAIHRQYGLYLQLFPFLNRKNTIILDGEDVPYIFPYHGYFWRKPYLWFIPKPHKKFLYFKREWIPQQTNYYLFYKLLPARLSKILPIKDTIRKISFSIPEEKIVSAIPEKLKLFPKHIVDKEVADKIEGSTTSYAFEKEEDYYHDIQTSKFGITTKRAGWDCMRHYEIAANGSIICFKQLASKPAQCAPHGLRDGENCISYENYDELMTKIQNLSDEAYMKILKASLLWISENTSQKLVLRILNQL